MATQYTITKSVVANTRLYGSTWENTGPQGTNTVTMGMSGSTQHYAFFRFGDIDIPPYATIISATFKFYVSGGTDNSGRTHNVSGVTDNGTLWTESARNGAGRDTTVTTGVYVASKAGSWFNANIKAIVEAWRDGIMDATRGICLTHSGANSYKIIDGRLRGNYPRLTIIYEIPASIPIPDTSTLEIGNVLTINLTGVEEGVYHKIRYKIGETTLYTDEIGAATTSAYTIPTSAGQYFPNTLTGALTVECETYEDEEYTASRGSVTANVTLTLPSDKAPTCSTTLSKAWVDGVDAGAQFDVYVQGKGGVRVQTSATAMYGATIASYTVTCESKTYSGDDVTHKPFSGSGSIKVYTQVTDSRGVVSTVKEDTLTVIPWKQPQITAFSVGRVDASGNPLRDGVRMKATIKATANSITVAAAEENSIEFQVEYREKGAATWTQAKAVAVAGISVDDGYVLQDTLGADITDFDDMKGYDFVLALSDIYAASTATAQIATSEIIVDFNTTDNGVAFGGPGTGEKLESYKPAYFYGGIAALSHAHILEMLGVQTGETSISGGVPNGWKDVAVTFPIPYKQPPLILIFPQTGNIAAANVGSNLLVLLENTLTATGFTARWYNNTSDTRYPRVRWIAMGELDRP